MPFKATIELLIDTEDDAQACDAVAETLRAHIREFTPASCFLDWRYAIGGFPKHVAPVPDGFEADDTWPGDE